MDYTLESYSVGDCERRITLLVAVDCAHDSFFPSLAIGIGAPDECIVPEIVTLMIDFHCWGPVTLYSSLFHAESRSHHP